MQFVCTKSDLLNSLGIVSRAASKMQKSILECILFSSEENGIELKATDIQISIRTELEAQITEEGRAAIPARLLYEIISRFPDGDVSFQNEGENTMSISCMNAKVDLQLMDADEFPVFPVLEKAEQIKIEQNVLRNMISQTIYSVSADMDKPILTGLDFDIKKNSLSVVALDGYRMAVRRETIISEMEKNCVIPSRTLREIMRILEDTEENVKITVSGNMALFEMGDTQVYTALLEGDYVNYENLLPAEYTTAVKVEKEMLLSSIERASILAREGSNNVIKLSVSEKALEISSNSEMGKINEKIPTVTDGKDLSIAFNAKYILDVLKNLEESEIMLQFNTSVSPCVIKKEGTNKYDYLILPVQVREG